MDQIETGEYIKKVRKMLWYERLIYFPIKLLIAYFIYTYFDSGVFIIFAYLLFCVGEQSARQFINSQELNATIQQTHQSLGDMITENNGGNKQ